MNPAFQKYTGRLLLLKSECLITDLEETRALGSRKPGPWSGESGSLGKNGLLSLSNILLDLSSTLNRGMVIFPSFHFVCGFKVFRYKVAFTYMNIKEN